MLFDYLAVRLNGPKAAGKKLTLNMAFSDLGKQYALYLENGVLNYSTKPAEKADASLTLTKTAMDDVQLGKATLEQQIAAGKVKVDGRKDAFGELMGLMDDFDFWFNIVTP
ncbi:hypothetical protein D3C78_1424530 [compost metagenome]